jgi:hypothetical protein
VLRLPDQIPVAQLRDVRHHQKQVGVAGLLTGRGQQGVRLATVVGLVVEEMGDEQALRPLQLAVGGATKPCQVAGEPRFVDSRRPALDIGVTLRPHSAQFVVILDHVGALLDRRLRPRPVVEARHPLGVGPQYVGQSAVDRAPERATGGAPLGVRQPAGGGIKPTVHFAVVHSHRAAVIGSNHRIFPRFTRRKAVPRCCEDDLAGNGRNARVLMTAAVCPGVSRSLTL